MDIRDAAAWGRLDQALTRLAEGKKGRGGGGGAPPHAASAPALRGSGSGAGSGMLVGEGEGEETEDEELLEPPSPSDASAAAPPSPGASEAGSEGGGRERRGLMGGIRARAATKLRQLAETTASKISRWVGCAGAAGGQGLALQMQEGEDQPSAGR